MDSLRDLPCYDKENFSKHSTGGLKSHSVKNYIKLKNSSAEEKAQVIVTDSQSLLLRELEKEAARKKRISLKRGSSQLPDGPSRDCKVPRTTDSDDSLPSLD